MCGCWRMWTGKRSGRAFARASERAPHLVWSKKPIYMKSNDDGGRGPSCDAAPVVRKKQLRFESQLDTGNR
jgi:hypothetical protein